MSLPAWVPGSYLIRDFAKHIIEIRAASGDQPLILQYLDKDSWRCEPCAAELTIDYQVYAWDLSVRAAYLDTTHGFFNGSSVFLRVHGQEQQACRVTIAPPPDTLGNTWRVATAMTPLHRDRHTFGDFQVANYEELIDHPVTMGKFHLAQFHACGVLHEVAITGQQMADMQRICNDLQTICEQHIRFFAEPAPVDYYLFLIMVVGDGYGGLEHRASCSLLCSRRCLPVQLPQRAPNPVISDDYREFLGLCSHEYFHTWNVKRIKPAAFMPYDLQRPVYTESLWVFEGITSYYDELALVRCGLITADSYLELLGQTITRVLRGDGRHRQSVAASSFYAWTKFYQQDENAPNAIVSYYSKGALVALCLDMLLREHSQQQRSLDDVMQLLWHRYGQTMQGVPEQAVETCAAEVAGVDLSDFFALAVYGTADLDLAAALALVGIKFHLRPADSAQDKGGRPAKTSDTAWVDIGAKTIADNGYPKLQCVYAHGAAQQAGLAAGDVIVAINGIRASTDLQSALASYDYRSVVQIHAFRRDELMTFELELQPAPATTCFLSLDSEATEVQQRVRAAWLNQ